MESAAAFGMELGGRLLINSGMPAGEADGLLDLGHERNTISYYERYFGNIHGPRRAQENQTDMFIVLT